MRKIFIFLSAMISGLFLVIVMLNGFKYYIYYIDKCVKQQLFSELKAIELENCALKRFGDAHDGGYLICENLMKDVTSVYSYGIDGRDKLGCDVSKEYTLIVHQYDCFNTKRPFCAEGNFIFHEECVGDRYFISENKMFDSLKNQIIKNKDNNKKLLIKMDVEGAEWDTLLATPDEVLANIDQLAVEFHGVDREKYIEVIKKLKKNFYLLNLHFNNNSCNDVIQPFPSTVYEILFVNKRIGIPSKNKPDPTMSSSLDSSNNPSLDDCQRCNNESHFEFWPQNLERLRQLIMNSLK